MQTMGNEANKTHCSHKELQCKQGVTKQGRLCSHNELQCKQQVMKQGRLIVQTGSYNAKNG
ncbi:hypothetical protein KSS87_004983 [Heliosperma pusillum]|nr:hypothetical protein KSS87_004983 [Heliosperma pusillum]